MGRIERFEDLDAWNSAIELAVLTYKATAAFPKTEVYAMTNQMRRASSSISANIAEGFGRYGAKEKVQFYKIAAGSVTELKSFCYLARRLGYIEDREAEPMINQITVAHKQLNALIRSIKERHDA